MKKINKQKVINEYLEKIYERNPETLMELRRGMRFLANTAFFNIFGAAYTFYKEFMKKEGRACGHIEDPQKHKECLMKFRTRGLQAFNQKLKAGMSKCKEEKTPEKQEKCIEKIKNKIMKNEEKIKKIMSKASTEAR